MGLVLVILAKSIWNNSRIKEKIYYINELFINNNSEISCININGLCEEIGKCWSKCTELELCRIKKSRELMYSSTMTIVNNFVLNTENFLRR